MRFGGVAIFAAVLCIAIVAGAWLAINVVLGAKNETLQGHTRTFEELKFEEMSSYIDYANIAINNLNRYSDAVDFASSLFDFQPKMTRQIAQKLEAEFFHGMRIVDSFEVSGYTLAVNFFCLDSTHPAQYTDRLINGGYFEDVRFYGYEALAEEGGVGYTFSLAMRIKGGNIFES
jgi:hypothetical protein